MQTARISVPGSGMTAGAFRGDAVQLGGDNTVCGDRFVLACSEALVCGDVLLCGKVVWGKVVSSGVNVGGGALFGSVGDFSNLARAEERFGWYNANRVGLRLRRHIRYGIIGFSIAWLCESLLSSVQMVLSTALENAGARVLAQV